MNCPKCGGDSYISDEEFSHAAEKVNPPKLIVRATFVCKSCYEKFTRVMVHNLDSRVDGFTGTGSINKILGDLNFPDTSKHIDTSILESLGSTESERGPMGKMNHEKPRFY